MAANLRREEDVTVRLAIPLLGDDVAPRFCSAPAALVVALEADRVLSRERVGWPPGPIPARLLTLAGLGVDVVLCGGFNRAFLPMAERLGLRVVWRLVGPADAIVAAYAHGLPLPEGPPCPRHPPTLKDLP